MLNGNLEEAIELTYQLFPGILERNKNLLFALKVRQFIEMINNATTMNNSMDDTIPNDQENQNLSSTVTAKNLVENSSAFVLNNNNNIDNKLNELATSAKSLQKNGMSNCEGLTEEAMGRIYLNNCNKNTQSTLKNILFFIQRQTCPLRSPI